MRAEGTRSRFGELATLSRPLRRALVLLVVYAAAHTVFVDMAEGGGLLRPSSSVNVGFATLGVVVLSLRVVVLFVLVPLLTHALVLRAPPRRP